MAERASRPVSFFISSPDLGQYFEIRWLFEREAWRAVVHPMDGPTRCVTGRMDAPFGEEFRKVFGAFNAAHLFELESID